MKEKIIKIDYKNNQIVLIENNKVIKTLKEVSIGKNGVTNNKMEGDLCTPKGIFNLGFAFGTLENRFNYPYYKINNNIYWVDDIKSNYYNHWIEITDVEKIYPYSYMNTTKYKNWSSSEHLADFPIEYELAFVIDYNLNPVVKGKGSAIFFHIKNKETTSGCIATPRENLLYIIKWLDKASGKILIE